MSFQVLTEAHPEIDLSLTWALNGLLSWRS